MQSMLLVCRAIVWITSIVFLIVSLKTKKRTMLDCVKWVSLGSLFYLLIDIFAWPKFFDVNYGLDSIGFYAISAITGAILIAAALICIKKSKQIQRAEGEDIQRWPILYLLVAICLFAVFGLEYEILQDAHLIFVNETNGFAELNYSVAITDHTSIKVNIGEKYYKDGTNVAPQRYIVQRSDKAFFVTEQDGAPGLALNQSVHVFAACQSDKYTTRPEAQCPENGFLEYEVMLFGDSKYFIVTYYFTNVPAEKQVVAGQALFYEGDFVCDITEPLPESGIVYVYEGEPHAES